MTDEQLIQVKELIQKVKPVTLLDSMNMNRKEWEALFAIYNENNSPKLSTRCGSCYGKVLHWLNQTFGG